MSTTQVYLRIILVVVISLNLCKQTSRLYIRVEKIFHTMSNINPIKDQVLGLI